MSREHKKLRELVGGPQYNEQVARWFRDNIPDFSKDMIGIMSESADYDISCIYDYMIGNETRILIRAMSGSASPILKAIRTNNWSDRIVDALVQQHIFPITLARSSSALRTKLAERDFHDICYLSLSLKEVEDILTTFQDQSKIIGSNMLLFLSSAEDFTEADILHLDPATLRIRCLQMLLSDAIVCMQIRKELSHRSYNEW